MLKKLSKEKRKRTGAVVLVDGKTLRVMRRKMILEKTASYREEDKGEENKGKAKQKVEEEEKMKVEMKRRRKKLRSQQSKRIIMRRWKRKRVRKRITRR